MNINNLNNKNKKTLESIFTIPIPSGINWSDIESLFVALGGKISEGNGSRVRVKLADVRAVFHRPHPTNVTDKGAVKSVKKFLMEAGVYYV